MNLEINRGPSTVSPIVPPNRLINCSMLTLLIMIQAGCATNTVENKPTAIGNDTKVTKEVQDKIKSGSEGGGFMIVRSEGPSSSSLPAGKKLSGNSKITLKENDKVTILGKSGTRVLQGPGTYSVGGMQRSTTSKRLSSFSSSREKHRARTGAVRGTGKARDSVPVADFGEVKVIRGSKSALKRYKLKSTIPTGTKICLKKKESLTLLRKKGGILNLKGPGCNVFRRSGEMINVAGVSAGN